MRKNCLRGKKTLQVLKNTSSFRITLNAKKKKQQQQQQKSKVK